MEPPLFVCRAEELSANDGISSCPNMSSARAGMALIRSLYKFKENAVDDLPAGTRTARGSVRPDPAPVSAALRIHLPAENRHPGEVSDAGGA